MGMWTASLSTFNSAGGASPVSSLRAAATGRKQRSFSWAGRPSVSRRRTRKPFRFRSPSPGQPSVGARRGSQPVAMTLRWSRWKSQPEAAGGFSGPKSSIGGGEERQGRRGRIGQIDAHADAEFPRRFAGYDQQRIEFSRADPAMIRQAGAENRGAKLARSNVDEQRRLQLRHRGGLVREVHAAGEIARFIVPRESAGIIGIPRPAVGQAVGIDLDRYFDDPAPAPDAGHLPKTGHALPLAIHQPTPAKHFAANRTRGSELKLVGRHDRIMPVARRIAFVPRHPQGKLLSQARMPAFVVRDGSNRAGGRIEFDLEILVAQTVFGSQRRFRIEIWFFRRFFFAGADPHEAHARQIDHGRFVVRRADGVGNIGRFRKLGQIHAPSLRKAQGIYQEIAFFRSGIFLRRRWLAAKILREGGDRGIERFL